MSSDALQSAVDRLRKLINEARLRGATEANAAALATVTEINGRPSIRTVYVHIDESDLILFVNAASGKGRQLEWHPFAALCFFWRDLRQQVTLDGRVERLPNERADAVWQQRSRETVLVARASEQAAREGDETAFRARYRAEKQDYNFSRVARPDNWIGYRLLLERLEFWETGWHRMRMRQLYERQFDGQWAMRQQEP